MKQATKENIKSFIGTLNLDVSKLKAMEWEYLKTNAVILCDKFHISLEEAIMHLANFPLPKPEVKERHVREVMSFYIKKRDSKYYEYQEVKSDKNTNNQ